MKSNLHIKFILSYVIFGFLSLFTSSLLFPELITKPLKQQISSYLFQESSLISSEYLPKYFTQVLSLSEVQTQLSGMASHLNASIWLVDESGKILTYSKPDGHPLPPTQIQHFNPVEAGSKKYMLGTYHGIFSKEVITTITPVLSGYRPKGYLIVHKYSSDIQALGTIFLNAFSILFILCFFFSFLIFAAFHFFVYRPLRQITEAAKQYAVGNLDYQTRVDSQDEMGYLSASLNYMSSKLRDSGEYQKQFVANVSHDFRSPLTSIKGYVEAMVDGTIPPEFHEKYWKIILFETERLTDLTNDLLLLNEYDTSNMSLKKEDFDLHLCIRDVLASFEGICTKKKISMNLLLVSKTLMVRADKRKIQQVLYNLLDNATKFSENESTITVETSFREEKAYISIKDEGIGIPRNALNLIWDRFYKTDLSRGKNKKGTGLGLSIVKEAISAHGESIQVLSTEGVGTEFLFSLPLA